MSETQQQASQMVASVDYPIYQIKALTNSKIIVSGGGGSSKTGVLNKLDLFELKHNQTAYNTIRDVTCDKLESFDTDLSAIMNICHNFTCISKTKQQSVIQTLENNALVEYVLTVDADKKCSLKEIYHIDLNNDTPCQIASSSGSKHRFLALAMQNGNIFIISKDLFAKKLIPEPFIKINDISGGLKASPTAISFSPFVESRKDETANFDDDLLACICDRPDGNMVRILRFGYGENDCPLWGLHCCASTKDLLGNKIRNLPNPKDNGIRFKHCEFFAWQSRFFTNSINRYFLATTTQPIKVTRSDFSQLNVWCVKVDTKSPIDVGAPSKLSEEHNSSYISLLTEVNLPKGHLPACLATHPSRNEKLVAVGTMDGMILVYLLLPLNRTLSCLYSLPKAHSIFITCLSFLPPVELDNLSGDSAQLSKSQHCELVSASADRMIRWHSGPSLQAVYRESSYDGAFIGKPMRRRLSSLWSVTCLLALLFAPLCIVLIDHVLRVLIYNL